MEEASFTTCLAIIDPAYEVDVIRKVSEAYLHESPHLEANIVCISAALRMGSSSDIQKEVFVDMTANNAMFELVKASLWSELAMDDINVEKPSDWKTIYSEMQEQTIACLPFKWLESHAIEDETIRNKWLRICIQQQAQWIKLMVAQDHLIQLMKAEQIKLVIIKGAAAAMAYPHPSFRTAGDVDFLVKRADYEKAARVLEREGFALAHPKDEKMHHYGYEKDGISFELHKRLGSIKETDEAMQKLFEAGIASREWVDIEGFRVPVLAAKLNGLVLLLHINQHLRSGLGLRQVIDWMMYVHVNGGYKELEPMLQQIGMAKLADTVTGMCHEYLGLEVKDNYDDRQLYQALMDYILAKGNFGNKGGEEEKVASVFLDMSNPVRIFQRLQAGGIARWEAARSKAYLRPFAWLYQVGHIIREVRKYGIKPGRMLDLKKKGIEQRKLIKMLGLDVERTIKIDD